MKTSCLKIAVNLAIFVTIYSSCVNPKQQKILPPAVTVNFYSMTLSKLQIRQYLRSDTDPTFRRFIIQFYEEQLGNTINYKMRGWLLKQDLTSYPASGNLLTTGSPITKDIPVSPFYFADCEVKNTDFLHDILQQVGGLNGNWQSITLTPQQSSNGYLQVELKVEIPGFTVAKTIANPCPPKTPQG